MANTTYTCRCITNRKKYTRTRLKYGNGNSRTCNQKFSIKLWKGLYQVLKKGLNVKFIDIKKKQRNNFKYITVKTKGFTTTNNHKQNDEHLCNISFTK